MAKSPPASSEHVRKRMQANRSKDTKPELALRADIERRGLGFEANARPLPELLRTADAVFRAERIAVFVDGCYWHCCPEHGTQPKTNAGYWNAKLARNVERDADTNAKLAAAGWLVIRRFEHVDVGEFADEVERAVLARREAEAA